MKLNIRRQIKPLKFLIEAGDGKKKLSMMLPI